MKFTDMRSNQRKAIEALLEGKTREQAAERAGVTRGTIYNWLKQEDFREALQEQTRIIHCHVVARLIGSMDKAVSTLQSGCDGHANATQVRAANAIIGNAVTLNQALDQEARVQDALDRLAALEERDGIQDNGQQQSEAVRTWAN